MVEREGQVDHVVLAGAAQLVEVLVLQDLQVTDAGGLGEAWGWGETREGAQCQPYPSVSLLGFP